MLGLKIASAMGCVVTAISRSKRKEQMARDAGATNYVAMADEASAMARAPCPLCPARKP